MEELWKEIKANPNYEVSTLGRVRNRTTGIVLVETDNTRGYKKVHFQDKRITNKYFRRSFYIHRLVAEAFLENPNNLEEVNHKDFNRSNNQLSNLEWCSGKQNRDYSRKNGRYIVTDKMRENGRALMSKWTKEFRDENLKRAHEASRKVHPNKRKFVQRKTSRPIKCNETGRIALSTRRGADVFGVDYRSLRRHLQGKYKTLKGYTYSYLEKHRFNNYGRSL